MPKRKPLSHACSPCTHVSHTHTHTHTCAHKHTHTDIYTLFSTFMLHCTAMYTSWTHFFLNPSTHTHTHTHTHTTEPQGVFISHSEISLFPLQHRESHSNSLPHPRHPLVFAH